MTSLESNMEIIKVFELYSGIGGMHCALKAAAFPAKVMRAIDINPAANTVYKLNFPETVLLEKNIQSLSADYFNKLNLDMIMMSPPCQPFTRNGLRKDLDDHRNFSIVYIINLLPKLESVKYILLENVQGFECSDVRNELIKSLFSSNFIYQEFLLSPDQFSIPNSRLRYYLLGKKKSLQFCFSRTDEILFELPLCKGEVSQKVNDMNSVYKKLVKGNNSCFEIGMILNDTNSNLLPENVLVKYAPLLDIVTKQSVKTCCFTKSYSRYIEGTGSVYTPTTPQYLEKAFSELEKLVKGSQEYIYLLKSLNLRYFSPEEVSSLMCFPDGFKFPNDFTNRQKYKLLGNSVNVHVVAILLVLLLS